jgi:hypothetical protein
MSTRDRATSRPTTPAAHQHRESSAPAIVRDVLRAPGRPLELQTRTFMEGKFGHDFSKVRVHADERAGASARAVDSLAYTVGNNLVFASGQYAPGTAQGTRLLAHELTHVVQQGGGGNAIQHKLTIGQPHDRYEQEADRMAAFVAGPTTGQTTPSLSALPASHIQRACSSCQADEDKDKDEKH